MNFPWSATWTRDALRYFERWLSARHKELRRGVQAKRRTDGVMPDLLAAWVDSIETTFADRLLSFDPRIAQRWGELPARRSLPVIAALPYAR
jgi:hypothetical protein